MIAKLPKKPIYAGGDVYISAVKPAVILTAIKNGWMLYSADGKLVGQVFAEKKGAKFVVGDSRAYRVTYDGNGVNVDAIISDGKAVRYEVFGDAKSFLYEVYEYKAGGIKPEKVARVIPGNDKEYCVNIDEKGNVYRNLLLIVTITLLVMK